MWKQTRLAETALKTESHNGRDLSIKIENFGPITKGVVNLKPLTIFVGPNGCGKSHAASLFYIMANLEHDYGLDYFGRRFLRHRIDVDGALRNESTKIFGKHEKGHNVVYTDILNDLADPEIEFTHAIKKNFLAAPETLIQRCKKYVTLDVKSRLSNNIRIKITRGKISVDGYNKPKIKITFQEDTDEAGTHTDENHKEQTMNITVPARCNVFDVYDALKRHLTGLRMIDSHTYYFPAERAGLTLARQSITANYLYHRADGRLSRTATDYLAFLTLLPEKEGAFGDISKEAEKEIMNGEIIATATTAKKYPDIYFWRDKYKFPLHLAASSVKDLAPFFLYLRYVAEIDDLVILEEPEISLHPASQILLARFIVRLVNCGLYVVVTTHSPYFLEQISHCAKAGHMDAEGVDDILPEAERLRPGDVAPYKFLPRRGSGYEISEIPVSTEGIPQDEFLSVDRALYNELLRLRQLEQK